MIEIERKFLVATLPDEMPAGLLIRQGYLTVEADSIDLRLRQYGDDYFLTMKSGEGLVRRELETAISAGQFDTLWPATEGRRLEKTRHRGKLLGGQLFELDVFAGHLAPLIMVEVEFPSEDLAKAFVPPAWFGQEVTDDRRYRNRHLAQHRA